MNDVKTGLKTTEFWMTLLAAVLPVLNSKLGLQIPIEGVLSVAGVAGTYVLGRSWVKK